MNKRSIEKTQERLMTARRRIGAVCSKHPDIYGVRYKISGVCIKCGAENRQKWAIAHPAEIRAINVKAVALKRAAKKRKADDLARTLQIPQP